MTDFATQYREYQDWKVRLNDTPEAWQEHKALQAQAEKYDPVAEGLLALIVNLESHKVPMSKWGEEAYLYLEGLGYFDDDL